MLERLENLILPQVSSANLRETREISMAGANAVHVTANAVMFLLGPATPVGTLEAFAQVSCDKSNWMYLNTNGTLGTAGTDPVLSWVATAGTVSTTIPLVQGPTTLAGQVGPGAAEVSSLIFAPYFRLMFRSTPGAGTMQAAVTDIFVNTTQT